MKSVGILSQKGGSGKTVVATNLARSLQLRGHEVILVDTDPQGSAMDWAATSEEVEVPHTVGVSQPNVHKQLPCVEGYEIAIVDGAGKMERMSASVIKACDLILIPIQPAGVDLWAVGELVDLILSRQEATGTPEAALMVSRAIVGTNLAESVQDALSELELPLLEARTYQRIAYAKAISQGISVLDLSDEKAKEEINSLTNEVLNLL